MSEILFPTLRERVYSKLLEMIVSGELPLNSQLDERELAELLSVSRTPLREAIGKLVKEGIVEYRPYKGNFVRSFTAKQVSDLYEVRKALEALAVRLAIGNLTTKGLSELLGILEDVDAALDHHDLEQFNAADGRFHDAIAKMSENETLIESLRRLELQLRIMRNIANRDPGVVERTAQERPHILRALESRDPDLAARLMEEHIEGVRRSVVHQLEILETPPKEVSDSPTVEGD